MAMTQRPLTEPVGASREASAEGIGIDAWLDRLTMHLPPDMVVEATSAERAVLLDLARVAARRGERSAAPITTYLAGLAFADLPRTERLTRLCELVAALRAEA